MNEMIPMAIMMLISGLLSSMSVFANKTDDIRVSLNDIYMTFLMTGWMFLFMGVYQNSSAYIYTGTILVLVFLLCIRTQAFLDSHQFARSMIPHHSMAVLMSKAYLKKQMRVDLSEKDDELGRLAKNIIATQENEIAILKRH